MRLRSSLTTFVHLIDRDGQRVAQADKLPGNGSYPTLVWTNGERVIDRAYPTLLDRCAGGETVRVQVGWYELGGENPLRPRADSAGTTAFAGEMTLAFFTYPPDSFQPAVRTEVALSPRVTLAGYTLDDQALQAGSSLSLDLLWISTDATDNAAAGLSEIRLHLASANGNYELWQGPIAPGSRWTSGLALCQRIHASLPPEVTVGNYNLLIDQTSFANAEPISLGTVAIGPSTRLYELPELERTLNMTFTGEDNGEIILVGLSSEPIADPATNQLAVDLVWQPVAHINSNYNAFVHLLDNNGTIIAQSDAVPGGDKVTNRWLPGEVILDRHLLTLPPDLASSSNLDGYQLVAGLYDSIGMQRLSARTSDGVEVADGRVPLGLLSLPAP